MSTPTEPNAQQGAGDAGKAPETQNPAQTPAGPPAGQQGQGDGGTGKAPKFEGEFDPAKAARLVENLRAEVDSEKAKRTEMETKFSGFMDGFAKLFGGEEKQLTPEQIAQKAQESDKTAREATVKLAVFQTAGKHGADPDALLDSASFVRAIGKLDPSSDTFAANVDTAIKNAVDNNARLKAQSAPQVPAKGGVDMTGGTSGKRQLTPAEVDHLSKTNPAALVKAREDGLLKDYLAS
ncbi:hypothetical protein OG258_19915 [Streptomyces mirabilis]|uniref:hypothetical protein n=1 Tax=Streptomyces mirabilis TaxID=68239 RepID=UPI002E2CF533|nr:hypothetical protein [Streptomyces mirabilis]